MWTKGLFSPFAMTKKKYLSTTLVAIVILLYTCILFNMVTLYHITSCKQVYNATYIFRDNRGNFEAVIEVTDGLVEESDSDDDGDGMPNEHTEEDGKRKMAYNCSNLVLPTELPTTPPSTQCPFQPPLLVGRLNITIHTTSEQLYNETSIGRLTPGGFYKPRDCVPRERVAIIVPYRDRPGHLNMLLFHLHTFLQRQQLLYSIFVIEMAYPVQFNRGLLANVGFLAARDIRNFTCFIFHDVDQLPVDDRNLYRCARNPRHLSVSSSKYGYKLPYGHYIGGIVAFTPEQFIRINGFSNSYFGWGKEDDDLYKRIRSAKYKVDRPDPDVGVYIEIPHKRDTANPDNPMKDGLYVMAPERFHKDGINSVLYTRLAQEYRPLYTWIYINSSEALIMGRLEGIYARISRDIRDRAGT